MRHPLLLLVALFATCNLYASDTLRVNNNPDVQVDYTTLQDAVDAAAADDVIMLENSVYTYGSVTLEKRLKIIGTGYFLSSIENGPQQTAGTTVGSITFLPGSDGSEVCGVTQAVNKQTSIGANDVKLYRNKLFKIVIPNLVSTHVVNIEIYQNYVEDNLYAYRGSFSNVLICNNIILGRIYNFDHDQAVIIHNIIYFSSAVETDLYNVTFQNNILIRDVPDFTNSVFQNNISCVGSSASYDGNVFGVLKEDIFVLSGSNDAMWQLKEDSPARGAGVDGVDCGIFDGPYPYRLSGLPATPYIYDAVMPASGTGESGLPVSIKIKSNN